MPKYSDSGKQYSKNPAFKFLEKQIDQEDLNRIRELNEEYPNLQKNIEKNTPTPYNPKYISEKLMSASPDSQIDALENYGIINRMLKSISNDPYSDYNLDSLVNDHEEFNKKHPEYVNEDISKAPSLPSLEDVKNFRLSPQGKFKGLIEMLKRK
jgi:hypothetical protein